MGLGRKRKKNNDNVCLKPSGFRASVKSLLVCTFAINVLSLALPVMTLQVYDRILPNPGTGTLPILISAVCLAIILEVILRLCRFYVLSRSGTTYEHLMSCRCMKTILNADISKMDAYGTGEYLNKIASVGKLKDFYNGHSFTVYSELAFLPLFFVLIYFIGGAMVFIPAVVLVLFVISSLYRGYELRDALHEREEADNTRFDFLVETLEGVHTVKAFALENFFNRRYEALEEESSVKNYNLTRKTSLIFNTGAIFSHIMVAAVISFGAWAVLDNVMTSGGLIAILLLSGRMMQPVQKALGLWTRYQDFVLAKENVKSILQTPQQKPAVISEENIARLNEGFASVENISFQYVASSRKILNDVSLEIKKGDCILLSGGYSSGKSTLLKIMAGILEPQEGEISIDGYSIKSFRPSDLIQHIGYISTSPIIFRGTIRENITCFGQINDKQAQEVAALLHVDKDIVKLPSGFDTFLHGNNTDNITSGLKQRIAITRVLAQKPKIILFDNADRSLDKEGYKNVYSLLARLKGKASMVLVSEDKNICQLAEKHYFLESSVLRETANIQSYISAKPFQELRI